MQRESSPAIRVQPFNLTCRAGARGPDKQEGFPCPPRIPDRTQPPDTAHVCIGILMKIQNHAVASRRSINTLVDRTTLGKEQRVIGPRDTKGSRSEGTLGKEGVLKVALPPDFPRKALIVGA